MRFVLRGSVLYLNWPKYYCKWIHILGSLHLIATVDRLAVFAQIQYELLDVIDLAAIDLGSAQDYIGQLGKSGFPLEFAVLADPL